MAIRKNPRKVEKYELASKLPVALAAGHLVVELKDLFVLNVIFNTCSAFWGFPSLDFLQLRKMMPALVFNFMIAATNA